MDEGRTTPWLFLAPSIFLLLAVVGYPLLLGFKLSLYDWQLATIGKEEYVGLANYFELPSNERAWGSLGFTLFYALTAVGIEILLGTLLALILHQLTVVMAVVVPAPARHVHVVY